MTSLGWRSRACLHWLGVVALTLGHVPLPIADYHSERHHDEPGELCAHHAHLVRWHPEASPDTDIAILHWHWLLPRHDADAPLNSGQASVHAHFPDGLEIDWNPGSNYLSEGTLRAPILTGERSWFHAALIDLGQRRASPPPNVRSGRVHAFTSTYGPGLSLQALIQRRDC